VTLSGKGSGTLQNAVKKGGGHSRGGEKDSMNGGATAIKGPLAKIEREGVMRKGGKVVGAAKNTKNGRNREIGCVSGVP